MEVTPSLSERSISPVMMATNQRKAALREKQDSKWHKIFSIKVSIIVWSTTQKYGKLIHVITLSGDFYPFWSGNYKDIIKTYGRVILNSLPYLVTTLEKPVNFTIAIM